jgi:hypothetical protein
LQLQAKTCQKPYAKTPQKPHKNLVRKNLAKIFYDFFNKKPAKNFKYIQKLLNFTLYKQNKMKKETQEQLFDLLYSLEDFFEYDTTEKGTQIGTLINQLQEELLNIKTKNL